jgi:hypothetical protein
MSTLDTKSNSRRRPASCEAALADDEIAVDFSEARDVELAAEDTYVVTEHQPGEDTADPRYLPVDFWNARPVLQHIHRAALSRSANPDAVLASVLARVAAYGSHNLTLPPTIGGRVEPNFFVAVCGPPQSGKSIVSRVADDLLSHQTGLDCAHRSFGSGQSVAAAFFEPTKEGKYTVWAQVRHNALIYADEGEMMNTLASQRDSILRSVLRSAWMGEDCGTSGVKSETTRSLTPMSYRLGVVANFQPVHAAVLFADADGGLPQRFFWVMATRPRSHQSRPSWPGALLSVRVDSVRRDFDLPDEVSEEIIAEHEAIQAEERIVELLDAHATLLRLKAAALLAQLDHRRDVSLDDWSLAAMMLETSRACRADIQRDALAAKYAAEDEATSVAIRRNDTIKAHEAERPFRVAALADGLVAKAAADGPFQWRGRGGYDDRTSHRKRAAVREAVAKAIADGSLEQYKQDGNDWLRAKEPNA